jgi:hypothetical protein
MERTTLAPTAHRLILLAGVIGLAGCGSPSAEREVPTKHAPRAVETPRLASPPQTTPPAVQAGITVERLPMIVQGQSSLADSASYSSYSAPRAPYPSALLSPLPPVESSSIAPVSSRSIYRLPPLSDRSSAPHLEPTQIIALPPVSSIAPQLPQKPRNDPSLMTPRVDRLPVVTSTQRADP